MLRLIIFKQAQESVLAPQQVSFFLLQQRILQRAIRRNAEQQRACKGYQQVPQREFGPDRKCMHINRQQMYIPSRE